MTTIFVCLLLAILHWDLETHRIPDLLTIPGTLLALSWRISQGVWIDPILGALAGVLIVFLMVETKIQIVGGGDAKLMMMVGAFTNWWTILITLVLGYLFSLPRRKMTYGVFPYSPYLITALGAILLCQNVILYLIN